MLKTSTINKLLFFAAVCVIIKLVIHTCNHEGQSNNICSKYTKEGSKVEDCGDLDDLGNISECLKCF